jgi:hypothetical protein
MTAAEVRLKARRYVVEVPIAKLGISVQGPVRNQIAQPVRAKLEYGNAGSIIDDMADFFAHVWFRVLTHTQRGCK